VIVYITSVGRGFYRAEFFGMQPSRIESGKSLLDPLNSWPTARPYVWALLAIAVAVLQGPSFLRQLRVDSNTGNDFFQEWASARNYREGLPIYMGLGEAVKRHLGESERDQIFIEVNAHPPTSVLLAVPFAAINYQDADLIWNLLMLVSFIICLIVVISELGLPFQWWSWAPIIVLTLLCNPFRQQMTQGQLNLLLLPMFIGFWIADRRGKPIWMGIALGLATACKLFPGALFLYLLLTRQWRAMAVAILTIAIVTGFTVALFGVETFQTYVFEVLPRVKCFVSGWMNLSLTGLWTKLFDPAENLDRVEPLFRSPLLARVGALGSSTLVVIVLAWVIVKSKSRAERDSAYGLSLTAMLLISPIAWDHYLLLLMVPLTLTWLHLPASPKFELAFYAIVAAFWISPVVLYRAFIPGETLRGPAYPGHVFFVLSFQCWAVLAFFALQIAIFRTQSKADNAIGG